MDGSGHKPSSWPGLAATFAPGRSCYARAMIEPSSPSLEMIPPNVPALTWEPEEFVFGLQYAGRPAGTTRWISGPDRAHWLIRVETSFTGVLGNVRRVQVSKLETASGLPVSYVESDGGNGRSFETTFDRKAGLVTVHQYRDVASAALTQDYLDPVSVLQMLRTLPASTSSLRVPMVGGTVLIARLPDETVRAPWGEVPAHVFYLRPGIGLVYIEVDAPHRILRLGQTVGKFMLEGWLTRAGVPQVLPMQVERGRESVQPRAQATRGPGPRARVQEARAHEARGQDGRRGRPERPDTRPAVARAEGSSASHPSSVKSDPGATDQLGSEQPSSPPARPDQARLDQTRVDQTRVDQTRVDQPRAEGGRRGNRRKRRGENRDVKLEAGSSTGRISGHPNAGQQNVGQPTAGGPNPQPTDATGGSGDSPRKRRRRRSRRGNARGGEGGES
jgi:Protein of unknown function (DUF3108)